MKQISLLLATTLLLLAACSDDKKSSEGKETNKDTTTAPRPMDTTGMTKAWENFMTPGEQHGWLAKFNGTWEADIIGFMNPEHPDTSKATNVTSTFMNGLFQEGKYTGNMMGMPFEGRSLMGYDNAKKVYVSTWIDNMGSGVIYMTGHWDEAAKTLHLKGKQSNPMDGTDMDIREEMKIIDDNTYTLTMYGIGMSGQEEKFMEGTFRRKM